MTSTSQLGFDFSSPRKLASQRIGDITQRKSKGHRNSVAAFESVQPYRVSIRERLRVHIAACSDYGATLKELSLRFGKPLHALSGRLSEAKADGVLFDSGRQRESCTVWVSRKQWCNGSEPA